MDDVKYWKDRKVFITGANGFLAGWLISRLLELKSDVTCLVRDWNPKSQLNSYKKSVNIVYGDVRNQSLMERILGEYEIENVFHLASQTIVGIANRNPVSTFESNINGTWSVLEACRRSPKVKSIIVSSSDKAYGNQDTLPYREDTPLQGSFPYDVSKSCEDLIAQSYYKHFKLPVTITRCGNFYGGWDFNFNRLIPDTIRSINDGVNPIIRSDGTYVRDYLYIEDAVEAYITLSEQTDKRDIKGQAFNFSTGKPSSVIEVVETVITLMKSNLLPIIKNEVSSEIKAQYLDSTKANVILGWKPKYDLKSGLMRTICWYKGYLSE